MLKTTGIIGILFSIIFFIGTFSYAQGTFNVKVLDKKSNMPVVYAYVALGNDFKTYTDTKGYCSIPFADSRDKVTIRCLGYIDYIIIVSEIENSGIVYLKPKDVELPEVVVRPDIGAPIITHGYIKQRHVYTLGSLLPYNVEACTFVPLPTTGEKTILTIRIKMEQGTLENPVRLHIYSANDNGLPGQELLDSNVIIYNRDIREDEYTLSVASKNIKIINDKIFIGVEWPGLYKAEAYHFGEIGPRVKRAESISENRTYNRSAKSPAWSQGHLEDKRPPNILVSVDYTITH